MKWKLALAGLLLAALMTGTASAQSNSTDLNLQKYNLSEYESTINKHTDELPGWIKDLVGDQDLNIYIDQGQNDSYTVSIKMNGLKVQNISDSALENPDIEVWTSSEVIQKIIESKNPVEDMKQAINNGEIEYQANDAWTKIKLFFADLLMGLL
ncbi:hypothetical protein GKQ38_01870 [Candidatus Nanohaloarchaea archaeon]|nr:hypothetical protein GKQ38_01870 [Candidatus Nanohaloarchaea archaeon]